MPHVIVPSHLSNRPRDCAESVGGSQGRVAAHTLVRRGPASFRVLDDEPSLSFFGITALRLLPVSASRHPPSKQGTTTLLDWQGCPDAIAVFILPTPQSAAPLYPDLLPRLDQHALPRPTHPPVAEQLCERSSKLHRRRCQFHPPARQQHRSVVRAPPPPNGV